MKKFLLIASLLLVIGAGCSGKTPEKTTDLPAESEQVVATTTWTHPKFGFSFVIPSNIVATVIADGGSVTFASEENVVAVMAVQPGIPGLPLPDNKVEKIKLNGQPGHLYHDMDAETGLVAVDKLIVDFPDQSNTVFIAQPVEAGASFNMKQVIASWKWKK